jgi:hypothetical protein
MSATNTNIQAEKINFQLRAIELLDFNLNHPGHLLQELSTFHFDLNIEHKINTDKKVIFVVNDIQILNESRTFNLGSIKVNCAFEIENLMDFVDSKKNTLNLPDQISNMLNSITISTTRGIMFSQFKGTFLHNAYLPVIDPQSFISQVE